MDEAHWTGTHLSSGSCLEHVRQISSNMGTEVRRWERTDGTRRGGRDVGGRDGGLTLELKYGGHRRNIEISQIGANCKEMTQRGQDRLHVTASHVTRNRTKFKNIIQLISNLSGRRKNVSVSLDAPSTGGHLPHRTFEPNFISPPCLTLRRAQAMARMWRHALGAPITPHHQARAIQPGNYSAIYPGLLVFCRMPFSWATMRLRALGPNASRTPQ